MMGLLYFRYFHKASLMFFQGGKSVKEDRANENCCFIAYYFELYLYNFFLTF